MKMVAKAATSIIAIAVTTFGFTTTAHAAPSSVWTDNVYQNKIIMKESGGNPYAVNPSSGAMGLYQCHPSFHSCPALGNVSAQHAWGKKYVMGRYGSWSAAWNFHRLHNWY